MNVLKVTEGNRCLDIPKGAKLFVTEHATMGVEYSHCYRVQFVYGGRTRTLYSRHKPKDKPFNLNNGDPTKKIRVQVIS